MSKYHKLTVEEKEKRNRDRMREPAVTCPHCEVKMPVAELLAHVNERCEGKREPHPLSKWLTWTEVVSLGAPVANIKRWVAEGRIRTRGKPGKRAKRYLARDAVKLVALRLHRSKNGP